MNVKNEFEKICDELVTRWKNEGKDPGEMYEIWSRVVPVLDEIMHTKIKLRSKQ
jgi:hypothetical protein